MSELDRYSRQMRVPGFGSQAQQKLLSASILIVGAGGLGGPVAAQLAGAGVGQLQLIDFDTVALSNLHRQWIFTESDIGKSKADVLAQHLCALNTQINVETFETRASLANIEQLTNSVDLIIDCADNFPTSYLLSDQASSKQQALLTASANQRFAYVGLLCGQQGPSLRAVFPRVPLQSTACDIVGVSGPAVTTIAGLQAQIAIDYLVDAASSKIGEMHYLDVRNYTLKSIDCTSAPEPDCAQIQLLRGANLSSSDWVIDVRDEAEIRDQAQLFPVQQELALSRFDIAAIKHQSERLVFTCRSGQRAMIAAQLAVNAKHQNVGVVIPD